MSSLPISLYPNSDSGTTQTSAPKSQAHCRDVGKRMAPRQSE